MPRGSVTAIVLALVSEPGLNEPYPLVIRVGEVAAVCMTQEILCPAGAPICDDPTIADGELTAKGLGFRGLRPGTTLCSAAGFSGQGIRRAFRVTVVP